MNYIIQHSDVPREYIRASEDFLKKNNLDKKINKSYRIRSHTHNFDLVIDYDRDTEFIYRITENKNTKEFSIRIFRVIKEHVLPLRYRGLPECCILSQLLQDDIGITTDENKNIVCEKDGRWSFIYDKNDYLCSEGRNEKFNTFWTFLYESI